MVMAMNMVMAMTMMVMTISSRLITYVFLVLITFVFISLGSLYVPFDCCRHILIIVGFFPLHANGVCTLDKERNAQTIYRYLFEGDDFWFTFYIHGSDW